MRLPIFLLGCLALHAASAETIVQACKDASGAVYYQNAPTLQKHCEPVGNDSMSVIPADSHRQRLPIAVGMSQDQVRNNWGAPAKVIRYDTRAGRTEQWEYRTSTLTFANGVLEVIQH